MFNTATELFLVKMLHRHPASRSHGIAVFKLQQALIQYKYKGVAPDDRGEYLLVPPSWFLYKKYDSESEFLHEFNPALDCGEVFPLKSTGERLMVKERLSRLWENPPKFRYVVIGEQFDLRIC